MLRTKVTNTVRVWNIEDKGNYSTANISSGRKIKENDNYDKTLVDNGIAKNGYVNSNWNFVRFIGHAHNQLKEYEIKNGDAITNLEMNFQVEPYMSKEGIVVFPKEPKMAVWSFELDNQNNQNIGTKNIDKAPKVANEPASQYIAPAQPTYTAPVTDEPGVYSDDYEDEMPF